MGGGGVQIISREGQSPRAVRERAMESRATLGRMGGADLVRLTPVRGQRRLDIPEILRQVEKGDQEKARRWSDWCDAYALTMPDREAYRGKVGNSEPLEQYNSVGGQALSEGVSNVIDTVMPPEREWMRFASGGRVPEEARPAFDRELEPWTERFFDQIHASNHAQEAQEMGYDLFLGLGPMICNKGTYETPLRFAAVPLAQVTPVKGPWGSIETVHRKYDLPVGHVLRLYPITLEMVPQAWADAYRKDRETPVEVIESTVYQPDTDDYVIALLDPKTKTVVWHVVSVTSPWIMPEWERVSGQMFPRGPLNATLADLRMLNQLDYDALIAGQLRARPPLEVMGMNPLNPFTVRLESGALHYTNPVNGQPTIRPFDLGVEPQWPQLQSDRLVQRVKDGLLASEFLAPPGQANNVSATEVMLRRQVAINKKGANYGRLQGGYLYQLARRASHILSEFGMFPPIRINNRMVRLRYVGPLQQARDATEVDNVHQWARRVRDTVGQEAYVASVAIEEIAEWDARKSGIDSTLYRDEGERAIQQKSMAAIAAHQMGAVAPAPTAPGGEQPA